MEIIDKMTQIKRGTEQKYSSGWIKDGVHNFLSRVHYHHTDASGVVYHARYFNLCDSARTEWLDLLDMGHKALFMNSGLAFALRHAENDWLRPAFPDDLLKITSWPLSLGRATIKVCQEIYKDDDCVFKTTLRLVCVNMETMRPAKFPQKFVDIIKSQLADREAAMVT